MREFRARMSRRMQTVIRIVVLFAVLRVAFGIVAIVFLSDGGLAYSLRATLILAAAAIVSVGVALLLRWRPASWRPRG
jgi:membrane protein YdbS with pleckstrin-like domain